MTSGIGEHIQGLIVIAGPVIQQGRAQALRSLTLPFQIRDARYAEVVMHLLAHVICRLCRPYEFFDLIKREYPLPCPVDQHKPAGIILGPALGQLITGSIPQAKELPVELRESPAVRGIQRRVHQHREGRYLFILHPHRQQLNCDYSLGGCFR